MPLERADSGFAVSVDSALKAMGKHYETLKKNAADKVQKNRRAVSKAVAEIEKNVRAARTRSHPVPLLPPADAYTLASR